MTPEEIQRLLPGDQWTAYRLRLILAEKAKERERKA